MPLKCYTRERKDGSEYITCNPGAQNNNSKNNKSKKNISNKKMPPKKQAKTIDEEIDNLMNTPSMKKVNAKPDKPKKQAKGDVDKEIDNLMKTKTMKKVSAKLDLDKLPPAKTEKNKKFLSYVSDNRKIKFVEGAKKKGKAGERFDKYKSAKTVVQMLEKGATFYDFINDVERGLLVVGGKN